MIKHSIKRRDFVKKAGLLSIPIGLGLYGCQDKSGGAAEIDIAIIGAGLSGLNAALTLQSFGYKSTIIEATDRIGGRVFTAKEKDVPGHPELGANGIGGGYGRLITAATKYGVEIGPMRPRTEPRKGELLYALYDELITTGKWKDHPKNPFHLDWAKNMSPGSVPWRIYDELNPLPENDLQAWRDPKFSNWDKSIESVMLEKGFSEEAIKLSVGTNSSYGISADDMSILNFFQILNFIGQQSSVKSGKGGAAIGGNQRIPEAMANAYNGDIRQSSPVKAIDSSNDQVTITLDNDKTIKAKYVIVTLPAYALRRIKITPALPKDQKDGVEKLGYTPSTQIHYVPTEKYWEKDGLPPSMWSDKLCGRFMAMKNDLDDPDKVTSCVAYTNTEVALKLSKMKEAEAINAVTKELERIRPSTKGALKPVYFWKWSNNPYAGGAYAYWKPGQITKYAPLVANAHKRIHFAGEHTALSFRGMEGAMESGERAASEVMKLVG